MTEAWRFGRVSTTGQNEQGAASIPDQDRITADYVSRKGWTDLGFSHDEQTGTNMARPEWQALVARCKPGQVIVVHKIDRFARSLLAGVNEIARLAELQIDLVIVDPELDTTTPFGRAFRSMLLVFAELDRDMIVSRMAQGQFSKAARGGWPSSAAGAPFGLRKEGSGRESRLVEHEQEAATIRKAAELLVDESQEITATCHTLNALGMLPRKAARWYPDLLRQVMSERARMGEIVWGKTERNASGQFGQPTLIKDAPAVLSPARFELVQLALRRKAVAQSGTVARTYPLSVRMTSPCGQVYHGVTRNDMGLTQYKCKGLRWQPWPEWQGCGCTRLKAADIEARVWAEVVALLSDGGRMRELARAYLGMQEGGAQSQEAELATLDRQIGQLQDRLSADMAGYLRAGIDPEALAGALEQLEDELAALRRRRGDIARLAESASAATGSLDQLDQLATVASHRLANLDLEQQAEMLALLDVRVSVLEPGRTPALRITGTLCSPETTDPARNAGGQGPRRGSGRASAR